ncbi:MAG TPA: hypothetical protein DDY98_06170, partial [Ruminococcaceae bacterium]|nr:hypothetical protein [Oscillospiraceae bacterium]
LPDSIVTPFYTYPLSEYNEDAKSRFNRTIPCEELLKDYGEERVFCFNYAPFGSIEKLTDKLNDYINNIQDKYFPGQKVILVPMSMGAATVSNYLYKYGTQGDVAKVVSIVGCWDGSDVFADLLEGKYADNSPEIFYTQLISSLVADSGTSSLINILLHCCSKSTLTPLLKNVVKALCDEVILKSPTMLALVPSDRYDDIRKNYLTRPGYEDVLKEADEYHEAQSAVKTTLKNLNQNYGTEFYFVAGYDLAFGEVTTDYAFFKCFASSPTTNSDEIIQIGSTAPGTTSVTANKQFSQSYLEAAERAGTAKYISPDKSIDVSTCIFPDHCWVFCKQKHELERNNVALQIALGIARGELKDINTNSAAYPQFNEGRNLGKYEDNYSKKVKAIIADEAVDANNPGVKYSDTLGSNYASIKAEAVTLLAEGEKMVATTVIDMDKDNATIEKFRVFCEKVDVLINGEPEADKTGPVLTKINQFIYSITGPKGIPDLFK